MDTSDPKFCASRRSILKTGVMLAASTTAVLSFMKPVDALADKADKTAMMYQDKPHGNQQCSNCIQFVPGSDPKANGTCKVVAGDIGPTAWCVAYSPKQS